MKYDLGTYVYLSSLYDIDQDFARRAEKYSTFKPSKAVNAKKETINPIVNAITQLKNIAATQAQKEHEAISNYIRKLDKYIKDESCPKDLRDKLDLQRKQLSKQNLDFNTFQSNQYDLINAINIIQQDLRTYQQRMEEITTPVTTYKAKQRLPYDIQSRVERFFDNQTKKPQKRHKNIIRDQKIKNLIEKKIFEKLQGYPPELIQELIALIFIDFNVWTENNDKSYLQIDPDDLESLFNIYEEGSGHAGQETHTQKILRTSQKEMTILLKDIQNNIHSTYLSHEDAQRINIFLTEAKQQKDTSAKTIMIQGKSRSLRQAKQLLDNYNKNIDENDIGRFTFTQHTRTSHGNFYELLQTIITSAANVSANVGADLILPIGTITWGSQNEQNQQRLLNLSRDLGQLLSDDFNKQETITIENFNLQVEKQKELSKSLQARMQNTAKTLTKMGELNEEFFIAHESLKLYRSSEEANSDFEEFHGRKMNILSALSKLYASPLLANNMVDSKLLITYLINISDATLAKNQRPLETYLSLFAGLLMFDDIKSIAEAGIQEIISNIDSASLTCLHLYNIDGIYFPISVILNNLISQMEQSVNNISALNSQGTAVAIIEGPTPEIPERSINNDPWDTLANSTIQNTTIQIHFLQGFNEYIKQLFNNFK